MNYRAEIDGLRAVAVVPVILFHAGFDTFRGGFVGVDIFFVISGFLITSILIEDIKNGNFSLIFFYERRARRILPALFFVMLCSLPFAWMWMMPSELKDFSQSLVAVSVFASNLLFYFETGYFEGAAHTKPLLHTWSLAVEEQYYLIFPLFLLVLHKLKIKMVVLLISILTLSSFALSEYSWRNEFEQSFYLAPVRAWELLLGSLTAYGARWNSWKNNNWLACLGMCLIVISIYTFSETTPTPSFFTLVPIIGTILIIVFGDYNTWVGKVLSIKPLQFIGLISYSAYLWHQPLFAFARLKVIGEPDKLFYLFWSVLSLFLGYLSWRFVEKPFRNSSIISNTKVFILSFFGIAFFTLVGLLGHFNDGYLERYSKDKQKLIISASNSPMRAECHFPQNELALKNQFCSYHSNTPSYAVIGNSHATEIAFALAEKLKMRNDGVLQATISGCRHNFMISTELESICHLWHERVVDVIKSSAEIQTVVISYRNDDYLGVEEYRQALIRLLNELLNAKKEIILVLQAPLAGDHINDYLRKEVKEPSADIVGLNVLDWLDLYSSVDELLGSLPPGIKVLDPKDILCDQLRCFVIKRNKALYFDDNHLSVEGARYIADFILKASAE
jgi:peptidoglycan/LPS O-acetylase OafA/YrhL